MVIEYKTRTQIVVEAIREKILTGAIKAGEPLRQAVLAKELNVSRIPIREALLQLEAEGLVEFEAHKGATATKLSVEQVRELFDIRALLECNLLRQAIPKLSAVDLEKSEQILTEMAAAFNNEASRSSWSELNTRFHLSLYYAANRPLTYEIVQNLINNSDRYIRVHLLLAGGIDRADPEHTTLLTYCKNQQIDEACKLLYQHITAAADEIIAVLHK
ncbi:GntR family transcriptional regulator [Rheinheimera sp. MMS21-TC3]|uniref:GntR family transcriptional regulator n=1 Tax=Rheinheimera sp. MMS21-TC3 TaxID=3072790 RepID=UPI0028C4AD83|nr:GntR family transcriptional regulator [Rheinheimera sp. MMS21-TC3]WNO61370.1 GntR family transcriptional regulator [Rheinheimera sp. MMS21-TC3]